VPLLEAALAALEPPDETRELDVVCGIAKRTLGRKVGVENALIIVFRGFRSKLSGFCHVVGVERHHAFVDVQGGFE